MYPSYRKSFLSRKYDKLVEAVTRSFKKHPLETTIAVVGTTAISSVIAPVGLLVPATAFAVAARETHDRGSTGFVVSVLSGVMAFATIAAPFFVQDSYRRPAVREAVVDLYRTDAATVVRRHDSIGPTHWTVEKDGASVRVDRVGRKDNCITVKVDGEEQAAQFCSTASRPEGYEGAEILPALARR